MLGEEKNLKDEASQSPTSYGIGPVSMSFTMMSDKTGKLITALYMVTDILDKDEPIRNKLRTLGANIISDIHSINAIKSKGHQQTINRIHEIVSFLDIAFTIGIISEMNQNILKKEFFKLKETIEKQAKEESSLWLEEFLSSGRDQSFESTDTEKRSSKLFTTLNPTRDENSTNTNNLNKNNPKGQVAKLGIQKGSTLLKALSEISLSDRKSTHKEIETNKPNAVHKFDILKKQRREEIVKIIKEKKEVSIKDIVSIISNNGVVTSEKTIQRELLSMVTDGVLYRAGEKRWARYSVKH